MMVEQGDGLLPCGDVVAQAEGLEVMEMGVGRRDGVRRAVCGARRHCDGAVAEAMKRERYSGMGGGGIQGCAPWGVWEVGSHTAGSHAAVKLRLETPSQVPGNPSRQRVQVRA